MKRNDIINTVIKILEGSTHVSWREGGVTQWADYAKKMHQSIRDSIDILETLDNDYPTSNSEIKELIEINKELIKQIKISNIQIPPFTENFVEFDTPLKNNLAKSITKKSK